MDSFNKAIGLRPRDFFDFIFGTSSGGLLAIMLGRLRMNVHDTVISFRKYAADVFDHPRLISWRGLIPWPREKYGPKIINAAIKECVKEREPDPTRPWKRDIFASQDDPCKTGVLAVRSSKRAEKPFMFRTYENINKNINNDLSVLNPGPAHSVPIWKVARATMAAPTYFEPVTLDLFPDSQFLDGGLGTNNPSFHGYVEVDSMCRRNTKESPEQRSRSSRTSAIDVLVSIGCGSQGRVLRFKRKGSWTQLLNLVRYIQALATDVEHTHRNMVELCRRDQPATHYFRFNVEEGLERILLDGRGASVPGMVRTKSVLSEIEVATRAYLGKEEVANEIKHCARAVMNARKFRAPQPVSPLLDSK